jgi:hypothetical protein
MDARPDLSLEIEVCVRSRGCNRLMVYSLLLRARLTHIERGPFAQHVTGKPVPFDNDTPAEQ